MYSREIIFDSPAHTYIRDLTPYVQGMVVETQTDSGLAVVTSRHTTMGIIVCELDEPRLLRDLVWFSRMLVPEDSRSTWAIPAYKSRFPVTDQFRHNCMDNPRRDPSEMDQDHNGARHIRQLLFSHPSVGVPIRDQGLTLGKYQGIAAFEFDGRDGSGVNPLRRRVVEVIIYPASLHTLPPIELTE